MGFFSSLRDKAMSVIANGIAGYFTPRWSIPPRRNGRDWLDIAHKSPRLDPVDLIAQDVASAEFDVVRGPAGHRPNVEDIPVYDSPIYDIIENPMPDHPDVDGWTFRYLSEAYLQITGECFWVLERRGMYPAAMYIIPPTWVISTPTFQQNFYRVMPLGNISVQQINIEAADMVWCKSPDLVNPYWRGRGRVESIGDEIESDEFAAKFQKRFFYNDATPPIIISAPGITKDDAAAFKESWMQNLGGMYNYKKPGIIPADVKIEKIADSPRELDFNESRRFLADVCREHFAIPPEMFGDSKNSNRATIESADFLYKKNVVSRRLRRWEMIYNRQLCNQFPGNQIIKFKDIVPEDTAFKLQKANEGLTRGAILVNEWRKENGLEEIDGGDVFLRPLGIQIVPPGKAPERVLEIAPEEEDEEPAAMGDEENPAPVSDIGKAMRYAVAKSAVKGLTDSVKRIHEKAVDASRVQDEALFIDAVKSLGAEQHSQIATEFRAARKLGQSYIQAMDTACQNVFGKSANEAVAAKLTPAWMTTMHDGAQKAADLLGLPPNFDLYNVYFSKWVTEVGALQITGAINDTTKAALQATIADAVEAGESSADIAKRINAEFLKLTGDTVEASRAMNIARTEAQRSINYGQLVTYKEEGVGRKEWLANSFGPDARDGHQKIMDVGAIGIDEDFTNPDTGAAAPAPGMFNDPGEDCQCRCTILPVVE
jgi:HK97 family phage portal protein